MPLTALGRDAILNNGTTGFTHLGALTSLAPAETSGGSYARQPIAFTTATGGTGIRDNNAQIVIPINAGQTIIAISAYSAVTAGNMLAYGGIGSSLLKGVGTVSNTTTDVITSTAHGLQNGDRVMVFAVAGEGLPGALLATGTISGNLPYHVVNQSADTFQLSETNGGASVNITSVGELGWAKTVPETFASSGNLTIATGAYDLDMNFG